MTTLTREALPLLRYRTRLSASLQREKCPCGRTGIQVQPGPRLDLRRRIKETEFYDPQIAEVLEQTAAAGHVFHLEITDRRLVVNLEMSERLLADAIKYSRDVEREIQSELLARLGLEAEVVFVQPGMPAPSNP